MATIAGIEIYNNDMVLQITGQFRNLEFISKGTLSGAGIVTVSEGQIVAARVPVGHKLSFTNGSPHYNRDYGPYISRNTTDVNFPLSNENGGTVYYYVFGYGTPSPGDGVGCEIYNSMGQLVFNGNGDKKHMKVIDMQAGTMPSRRLDQINNMTIGTTTVDPSITPAVLVNTQVHSVDYTYATSAHQGFSFSTDSVISRYFIPYYDDSRTYSTPIRQLRYSYLVLDVTGY